MIKGIKDISDWLHIVAVHSRPRLRKIFNEQNAQKISHGLNKTARGYGRFVGGMHGLSESFNTGYTEGNQKVNNLAQGFSSKKNELMGDIEKGFGGAFGIGTSERGKGVNLWGDDDDREYEDDDDRAYRL